MPALAIDWTAERVRALPDDGNRYEVVDGELLVTPAPAFRHQSVIGELFLCLSEYLRPRGFGHVLMSPADIELDPRTLVQPDLFVFPIGERITIRDWPDIRALPSPTSSSGSLPGLMSRSNWTCRSSLRQRSNGCERCHGAEDRLTA